MPQGVYQNDVGGILNRPKQSCIELYKTMQSQNE